MNISLVNAILLAAPKTMFMQEFDMQIQGVFKDYSTTKIKKFQRVPNQHSQRMRE